MNALTTIEKLNIIKEICLTHNITAYQISKETGLNTAGVQRLLNGQVKKPQQKTLNTILSWLNNFLDLKIVDSHKKNPGSALSDFSADDIIDYIFNNEDVFKESKLYNYFLEIKVKDEIINDLKKSVDPTK